MGRGVEGGGLGGDPSAASGGGDADQGDRPSAGPGAEHGAAGVGRRGAAEVSAAGEGLDRRRGRTAGPGAARGLADDAGDGDRRADRLDAVVDGAQGPGPGAPAALSTPGSGLADRVPAGRARAMRSVVPADPGATGGGSGGDAAGAGDGLGLLAGAHCADDPRRARARTCSPGTGSCSPGGARVRGRWCGTTSPRSAPGGRGARC